MANLPAFEAREVAKDYGDRPALLPLSLAVDQHSRAVLIGHNGSGKTTLLRIAAGLLDPTGGEVLIEGHAAGSLAARRRLAYLGDTPQFYDDLSVWEHLEYVARLHGVDEWEQRAADLLGAVNLYERADDLPTRFSRGMRQKAAVALAFVRPFTLLLVDEPFVGLDSTGRDALIGLMDDAHQRGAAIVVATHDIGFAAAAPRVIALSEGEVVFDDPPQGHDLHAFLG